jgi:retron-type reverse transcriptase
MQKFLEHRIGDTRMVRLVMKWMRAGVMEEDGLRATEEGTPQGGIMTPPTQVQTLNGAAA